MEKNFEHLLAPNGNEEFVLSINKLVEELNYELVRVKIKGKKSSNIQVMVENNNFTMSYQDCEIINDEIIDFLENEKKLFMDYNLEVSSPGIERPLTREKDFSIWSNNFIKMKLFRNKIFPIRFQAKLLGFFKVKVQVFIENYKDLNGEYDLDPLIIEEAKLLWVGKEPPKPNVIS